MSSFHVLPDSQRKAALGALHEVRRALGGLKQDVTTFSAWLADLEADQSAKTNQPKASLCPFGQSK